MQRGLKELLIDDYLDLDENDDDQESIFADDQAVDTSKTVRIYLRQLLDHPIYDYFMAVVVVSSSITLGLSLETDAEYLRDQWRQTAIYAFDELLIALLVLEFLFKLYLESVNYWFNWLNVYDFIIILFGVIEIVWNLFSPKGNATITTVLKGFRLLQLIRLYRIIQLSEGLQVLTKALIKTVLTYTFSVSILVFLFIYLVAVVGQMLYGKAEQSPWHHFPTSMVIAMRLILVDNWNIIGPDLERDGSPKISRWFLTLSVFIGNRIVTNVLVGLMIESVSSVNDDFIKEKREAKIQRHQKKREDLSRRTIEVLNTRFAEQTDRLNSPANSIEQMKSKLKFMQNEIITPRDLLFSIDWLEKLVKCSEKTATESRAARTTMVHLIAQLGDIIEENLQRNADDRSR